MGLLLVAGCEGPAKGGAVPPTAAASAIATAAPAEAPRVTHGVVVGDLRADSALLWARADRAAELVVRLEGGPGKAGAATAEAKHDFAVQVALTGLKPATRYTVTAQFRHGGELGPAAEARFVTAPEPATAAPVRFGFGGDVGGQNACRDAERDYPIFDVVKAQQLAFFVGLGDMIYADGVCETTGLYSARQIPRAVGPSVKLEDYWAHWRYNAASPKLQALRASTPYVAIWDDHETVNDAGPAHDARREPPLAPGVHLLPVAERAFRDHNPLPEGPIYRRLRWGKHLEIFVLDTRTFRDANRRSDDGDQPKTMLGEAQRRWFIDGLAESDATWTVVVSSVPIAIPTGGPLPDLGRDGWANGEQPTGFERELRAIFETLRDSGRKNHLWITTDVHFASAFEHRPFDDLRIDEIVTGPLHAGIYPHDRVDETFGTKRTFFHGPPSAEAVTNLDEALGWFNFGTVEVDAEGKLTARVIDGRGKTRFELVREPAR